MGGGVAGAAFTTTNPTGTDAALVEDGTGHCKNGNEAVNCNIYDGKKYVWMNGGPLAAGLEDGDYFFAVLQPGGQGGGYNPNDGTPNNLSDVSPTTNTGAGDLHGNRTFSISSHVLSYSGSHDFSNNKIRLMPYDDTPNPGGVYIMAICSLASGYPVDPRSCKYDAFKVKEGEGGENEVLDGFITIAESATNGIGEAHVFDIYAYAFGGTSPYSYAVSGSTSTDGAPAVPHAVVCDGSTTTVEHCTLTVNSAVAATIVANASATITDAATPQGSVTVSTDGIAPNSGPATKTYVAATLSWNKVSDVPGGALAGATFKIERIADRFGAALVPSDPIITGVVDCVSSPCLGTDQDPAGGAFRAEGLQLGTWRITETAAPAFYSLAAGYQDVVITDLNAPTGSASLAFVDRLNFIGETATVRGFPWSATKGAPSNWFMYAPWVTSGGQTGISTVTGGVVTGTQLIAGQHYIAGTVKGTPVSGGTRSITITLTNAAFRFAPVSNNVKIQPMASCSTNQKYVQPGQFAIKTSASVIANSITVSTGLGNTALCYGVHVDVERNPLMTP